MSITQPQNQTPFYFKYFPFIYSVLTDHFNSMFCYRHRFLQEIYSLLQSPRYKDNLFIKNVKIHNTPVGANCTAWLGGKLFDTCPINNNYTDNNYTFIYLFNFGL